MNVIEHDGVQSIQKYSNANGFFLQNIILVSLKSYTHAMALNPSNVDILLNICSPTQLKHLSVGNVISQCTTSIAVVLQVGVGYYQIINCYRQESFTNNNFTKHSTET